MPRLNIHGQALCAPYPDGAGTVSVDRLEILHAAGQACWLDDHTVIANAQISGIWRVVALLATGGTPIILDSLGANRIVAGGGRWLAWTAGRGMFGSLGDKPAAGVLGAGSDGTLAWCANYQSGAGLMLSNPDGSDTSVPGALVRDVQVLGPATALWQDFAGGLRVVGRVPVRPALPSGRIRLATLGNEDWLVYWSEGVGLIAQVDGAEDGYILETRPIAFNHDAVVTGGLLIVAWSTRPGEGKDDLVWIVVDTRAPRQRLVPADPGTPPVTTDPDPPRPEPVPPPAPAPHPDPPAPPKPTPAPAPPKEPEMTKPAPPTFDQWIKHDYPKVRAAYTQTQHHAPDDEWAAFQTQRYFAYWIGLGEYWPLERMLKEEAAPGSTSQADYPFPGG